MVHGLPLGIKYAFTVRATTTRELVDEIAGLAEIARKSGPVGLEKITPEDAFLSKGIRFVADGYDADFIRDNLERDRDNFLTHLDEGQKIYRVAASRVPTTCVICSSLISGNMGSERMRSASFSAVGKSPLAL